MAVEHSFDVVSKIDLQEVDNAINQALKEIFARFDFKGTKSTIELDRGKNAIQVVSDDEYKLKAVLDILKEKFAKRKLPIKAMHFEKMEPAAGGLVKQAITLQQGIPIEQAREIVKLVKTTKAKIQGEIQKDQVRIRGKNIDDLQAFMKLLQEKDFGIHMEFVNYR